MHEQLSALDAAFLYLERTAPLNIGSLAIFEGGPLASGRAGLVEVQRAVAARLHRLPRFRKKLRTVPFGIGHPVWVDDPDFDITRHVREARIAPPGGDDELKDLMARLQAQPLERDRPLWELWLVTGLAGDRFAIIQKTHHALVDGLSGVDAARALLDREPNPTEHPQDRVTVDDGGDGWTAQPGPTGPDLFLKALVGQAVGVGALARSAVGGWAGQGGAAGAVACAARTAWSGLRPATPSPFNTAIGPRRRFEGFSVALSDVNAVKRMVGGTANDVALAIVAGGLRHYLAERGEPVEEMRVRAMVPVSVRRRKERMTLGNHISAVFADLPVHLDDALDRATAASAEMVRLKTEAHADGIDWFLRAAEHVPAPLYAAVAGRLPETQWAVNLVVTNVPGPGAPLYCLGGRMVEAYPYLGPVGGLALMISVLRYNRRLFFGLGADADAVADMDLLAEAMEKAAGELFSLA